MKMIIAIASDHRGYDLKEKLKEKLEKEYEILDLGTNSTESVDFPFYGIKLGDLNVGHANDIYTFPYFCAFKMKEYLKRKVRNTVRKQRQLCLFINLNRIRIMIPVTAV